MRYQSFIFTALLSIALPLFTSAEPHGPSSRRHHALANRKRADLDLHRRDTGRATFFAVGLCVPVRVCWQAILTLTRFFSGACGITNVPADFVSLFMF